MKFLLLLTVLIVSSCSTYTWVDMENCPEKVGTWGKCKEVE